MSYTITSYPAIHVQCAVSIVPLALSTAVHATWGLLLRRCDGLTFALRRQTEGFD